MLNSPITRRDVLIALFVVVQFYSVYLYGNHRYNRGLEDMARFAASQASQAPADSAPSSHWGEGSTK